MQKKSRTHQLPQLDTQRQTRAPHFERAHATGVAFWARRHLGALRYTDTAEGLGLTKELRGGRLEQPVTKGLQLEGGAVRLADALEHAAAHAV